MQLLAQQKSHGGKILIWYEARGLITQGNGSRLSMEAVKCNKLVFAVLCLEPK